MKNRGLVWVALLQHPIRSKDGYTTVSELEMTFCHCFTWKKNQSNYQSCIRSNQEARHVVGWDSQKLVDITFIFLWFSSIYVNRLYRSQRVILRLVRYTRSAGSMFQVWLQLCKFSKGEWKDYFYHWTHINSGSGFSFQESGGKKLSLRTFLCWSL